MRHSSNLQRHYSVFFHEDYLIFNYLFGNGLDLCQGSHVFFCFPQQIVCQKAKSSSQIVKNFNHYIYQTRGRSPSTMYRSRYFARFSHCFAGGWTTNRPYSVFANSKASKISSSATVVERSSVSQAYSEISTNVHPLLCTSGCSNVRRRFLFVLST